MKYPRIMISAPASNSGKTMVTCGILRALVKRGLRTRAFKCGPDYIDPMFHSKIVGVPSRNLDTFFTGEEDTVTLFCKNAGPDISVVEGVMGHYDGVGGITSQGGSYDLSRVTKTPVMLVVNGKGMSLSLVPLIKGFLEYKADSRIMGVILNQISPMLYERMKEVIERELPVKVYGYLPKREDCAVKSRYLGLVTPHELKNLKEQQDMLAKQIEETVNLDGLIKLAREAEELPFILWQKKAEKKLCKIAVARDEAFCFYYEDNLDFLREQGCELVFFSPMRDRTLPEDIHGLLLGGGYPELYAKALSENREMRQSVKNALEKGMPCVAECGGFLYLHETLEDEKGTVLDMVGIIKGNAFNSNKLNRFGYVVLTAEKDTLLCKKGESIAAHEFHYWDSENCGDSFTAQKPLSKKNWKCIHGEGNLFAGFPHIHFYANKRFGENFIERVCIFKKENG